MSVSVPVRFRLALLTCAAMPGFYPDDAPLVAALRARGIEPVSCVWDDAAIDWSRFDAVLIRTPWDYFQRFAEFVPWLDRLPVPTINTAAMIRWNADKRYLLELQARGVQIIPMKVVSGTVLHGAVRRGAPDESRPGEARRGDAIDECGLATTGNSFGTVRQGTPVTEVQSARAESFAAVPERVSDERASGAERDPSADFSFAGMAGRDVVVKPTVSGGAWHTVRGVVGTPAFDAALVTLPVEFDYLVQDFVPEIVADGEWSLLFFDGVFSHAVIKRAKSGDYRVQSVHGGSVEVVAPSPAMLDSARHVLAATVALGHDEPAYARVDGVVVDGEFQLMELEVIEPALFFEQRPEAGEALAEAVLRRLIAQAH